MIELHLELATEGVDPLGMFNAQSASGDRGDSLGSNPAAANFALAERSHHVELSLSKNGVNSDLTDKAERRLSRGRHRKNNLLELLVIDS